MRTKYTVPNGYVIHADRWRVIVATGFARASVNIKTGAMIQVWILPRRDHPVMAVRSGRDSVVCFDCPIKPQCYVEVHKAPANVWRAFHRGSYPPLPGMDVFRGHFVRFGAWGDPFALPLAKLHAITKAAAGWTGYTHQHRNSAAAGLRPYLMASVESLEDANEAQRRGWRTFRIGDDVAAGESLCRAAGNAGLNHAQLRGKQCIDCLLCRGTAGPRNITIPAHGTNARALTNH